MKKKERKGRRKGESEEGREGGKGRREGIFKGLPRVLRPSSLRVGGVLSMEGCCSGKNFQGRTCSRKHSCPTTFGRCISRNMVTQPPSLPGCSAGRSHWCLPSAVFSDGCKTPLAGHHGSGAASARPDLPSCGAAQGSRGSSLPPTLLSQGPALSLGRGFHPAAPMAAPWPLLSVYHGYVLH